MILKVLTEFDLGCSSDFYHRARLLSPGRDTVASLVIIDVSELNRPCKSLISIFIATTKNESRSCLNHAVL